MKPKTVDLKNFYLLWMTQGLSQLGSAMTSFALTLWLFQKTGSALETALLSVCSYVPYVAMSIFAGALSDRWDKKRTMLACDTLAACCTAAVFLLLRADVLAPAHLYVLNALNGLMNTVQSPASDVAVTMVTPKSFYGKASGLMSFSRSLITVLHPVLATALYAAGGMAAVIAVDLGTFAAAFVTLLFFIELPRVKASDSAAGESLLTSARQGLRCLGENRLVLVLILFLAGVNFVASAFDAALPAFVLSRESEAVLGAVTSFAGAAMVAGSLAAVAMPAPKNRIRVIVLTMLFSLTADNFLMSLSSSPAVWCAAQVLGYLPVPIMNANLDVIVRSTIPEQMQGRVYACRNTLQFFTIPLGFLSGGFAVDSLCGPLTARAADGSLLASLFGNGAGSGAAMVIFCLGVLGAAVCLSFGAVLKRYRYSERC